MKKGVKRGQKKRGELEKGVKRATKGVRKRRGRDGQNGVKMGEKRAKKG